MTKRLKAEARNPLLIDTGALDEAREALGSHRKSLRDAKGAMEGPLDGARDELRHYKRPLRESLDESRESLRRSLNAYETIRDQRAFREAKQLVEDALPRKRGRARKRA